MVVDDKNNTSGEAPFDWLAKEIVKNRAITYPIFCMSIDLLAGFIKLRGRMWFDEQQNLINKETLQKEMKEFTEQLNRLYS